MITKANRYSTVFNLLDTCDIQEFPRYKFNRNGEAITKVQDGVYLRININNTAYSQVGVCVRGLFVDDIYYDCSDREFRDRLASLDLGFDTKDTLISCYRAKMEFVV
jgi:hypothetical protein